MYNSKQVKKTNHFGVNKSIANLGYAYGRTLKDKVLQKFPESSVHSSVIKN